MSNDTNNAASAPGAKRRGRKLPIILGVCAAVLVVAGASFLVWHEQPSFCNAICHSPMDPYVEGFQDEGTDLLVGVHAKSGYECLDCHEPTLSQQVSEGVKWVTGDFADPLESRALTIGTAEMCLECHDDGDAKTGRDWDDIVAATTDWGGDKTVNPHASHVGTLDCGNCHSVHGTSVMYCADCHASMDAPEGWA